MTEQPAPPSLTYGSHGTRGGTQNSRTQSRMSFRGEDHFSTPYEIHAPTPRTPTHIPAICRPEAFDLPAHRTHTSSSRGRPLASCDISDQEGRNRPSLSLANARDSAPRRLGNGPHHSDRVLPSPSRSSPGIQLRSQSTASFTFRSDAAPTFGHRELPHPSSSSHTPSPGQTLDDPHSSITLQRHSPSTVAPVRADAQCSPRELPSTSVHSSLYQAQSGDRTPQAAVVDQRRQTPTDHSISRWSLRRQTNSIDISPAPHNLLPESNLASRPPQSFDSDEPSLSLLPSARLHSWIPNCATFASFLNDTVDYSS
jgi:hypothetical protein